MAAHKRQSGMTLTELLVVIAIMAILLGITVPTAQHLMNSFEDSTGVRYLINAALSNARAIAVRNQAYAGVRFQQAADGYTYMIFIIKDMQTTGDANGFIAVKGRKPMKLPEDVSVGAVVLDSNNNPKYRDYFSVIFSPAGKLATHSVQCLRASSADTIFNSPGGAMFASDSDYWMSVQGFYLRSKDNSEYEYISPYTGELVMEYREKSL